MYSFFLVLGDHTKKGLFCRLVPLRLVAFGCFVSPSGGENFAVCPSIIFVNTDSFFCAIRFSPLLGGRLFCCDKEKRRWSSIDFPLLCWLAPRTATHHGNGDQLSDESRATPERMILRSMSALLERPAEATENTGVSILEYETVYRCHDLPKMAARGGDTK